MNVQEPPQFTPSQVLEAGRRAEAEGRSEYALQFYRHLVASYPGSGEAAAAMSALARIGANSGAGPNGHFAAAPPQHPAEPRFDVSLGGPQFQHGGSYAQAQPGPPPTYYPQGDARADPGLLVELPGAPRDYRSGRFLARMFSWLGGLVALAGLAFVVLAVLSPRLAASIPLIGAWGTGAFTSILLIFGGLFQLMLGQFVRAVLDHSVAARDIAAVTRAEAEARHGGPPGRSRRR